MAKKYGQIWRTDWNTPQTNHLKDLMLSKDNDRITLEQFMQISVSADRTMSKPRIFQQQTKINPFVIKPVLETICKRSSKSAIRANFNLKPELEMEGNSFQWLTQLYPSIQWSKREAVNRFLNLCLNHIWAPGQSHVRISKISRFLLVFAGQKHISGTRRSTNEQVHYQAPLRSFTEPLLHDTK